METKKGTNRVRKVRRKGPPPRKVRQRGPGENQRGSKKTRPEPFVRVRGWKKGLIANPLGAKYFRGKPRNSTGISSEAQRKEKA